MSRKMEMHRNKTRERKKKMKKTRKRKINRKMKRTRNREGKRKKKTTTKRTNYLRFASPAEADWRLGAQRSRAKLKPCNIVSESYAIWKVELFKFGPKVLPKC